MPMPQYNGPMYSQGPTAVGPYHLQGYQPTFGYNPQQTYMPQTPQPAPSQEPMATNTNAVTTAIANVARDITENQNANYRQLHDELVAYRMEDKDNTIAELRSQVNALNLSASQSNQNAYLVAQLKTPAPVPAYTVPNPNAYYGCQQNCYQSCGC